MLWALSLEFFADLVRTIDYKLFEGKPDRRVPQYSWEHVYLIKMAGVMVAHSLLQKGPGMPCLAPYVYEYLVSGEKEHAAAYGNYEDLPETSQTGVLKELIKRVSAVILHNFPVTPLSLAGHSGLAQDIIESWVPLNQFSHIKYQNMIFLRLKVPKLMRTYTDYVMNPSSAL